MDFTSQMLLMTVLMDDTPAPIREPREIPPEAAVVIGVLFIAVLIAALWDIYKE